MKQSVKKIIAATMAMSMCVPSYAFAAESTGSFTTSFDIYSPVLTVSVPTNLDIRVNPLAESSETEADKKFSVASNSLDIINASVDGDKDIGVPVIATVKATIASKGSDVVTTYSSFSADMGSKTKKVFLELSQAGTAAVVENQDSTGAAATQTWENASVTNPKDKRLKLADFKVKTASSYASVTNKAVVTKYGSVLVFDIAAPTTSNSTDGATFTTDATAITPKVSSFAITGVANPLADWKSSDLAVNVTYSLKAGKQATGSEFKTPTIATAPAYTSGSDWTIPVSGIGGEATVVGLALHNDIKDTYGDFIWPDSGYTVTYTGTGSSRAASIKVNKDDPTFGILKGDAYLGNAQDVVVTLTDGRVVVTTLTVN